MAGTFGLFWGKQTEDFRCDEGTNIGREADKSPSNWKAQEKISWEHWILYESNPKGENSNKRRNRTATCQKNSDHDKTKFRIWYPSLPKGSKNWIIFYFTCMPFRQKTETVYQFESKAMKIKSMDVESLDEKSLKQLE